MSAGGRVERREAVRTYQWRPSTGQTSQRLVTSPAQQAAAQLHSAYTVKDPAVSHLRSSQESQVIFFFNVYFIL